MTLKEYKAVFGTTYEHLAQLCGVKGCTIRAIAGGKARPSAALAKNIEKHTNGWVPAKLWAKRITEIRRNRKACHGF